MSIALLLILQIYYDAVHSAQWNKKNSVCSLQIMIDIIITKLSSLVAMIITSYNFSITLGGKWYYFESQSSYYFQ